MSTWTAKGQAMHRCSGWGGRRMTDWARAYTAFMNGSNWERCDRSGQSVDPSLSGSWVCDACGHMVRVFEWTGTVALHKRRIMVDD